MKKEPRDPESAESWEALAEEMEDRSEKSVPILAVNELRELNVAREDVNWLIVELVTLSEEIVASVEERLETLALILVNWEMLPEVRDKEIIVELLALRE